MSDRKEENYYKTIGNRIMVLFIIFALSLGYITSKLFIIQILSKDKLSKEAAAQRTYRVAIDSMRGDIFDRNNIPFTGGQHQTSMIVFPQSIGNSHQAALQLEELTNISYYDILDKLNSTKAPIEVAISDTNKLQNIKLSPWFTIIHKKKRYGETQVASHVVGNTKEVEGREVGAFGLEQQYEDILKSNQPQRIALTLDASSKFVPGGGYNIITPPRADRGKDIYTTLDYHIQKITETSLYSKGNNGAVVIIDIDSGDILAMASAPGYSHGLDYIGDYLEDNIVNRAIHREYSMGLMYNTLLVAAAMEDDILPVSQIIEDIDSKDNLFYIEKISKLDKDNIYNIFKRFGVGEITNIGLTDEKSGYIKEEGSFINLHVGDIVSNRDITRVTPLQMADITLTIINGGYSKKINIIRSIARQRIAIQQNIERIISKDVANNLETMMEVQGNRYSQRLGSRDNDFGAMVFTVPREGGGYDGWCTAFYPAEQPKYVITVLIEDIVQSSHLPLLIFQEIKDNIEKIR